MDIIEAIDEVTGIISDAEQRFTHLRKNAIETLYSIIARIEGEENRKRAAHYLYWHKDFSVEEIAKAFPETAQTGVIFCRWIGPCDLEIDCLKCGKPFRKSFRSRSHYLESTTGTFGRASCSACETEKDKQTQEDKLARQQRQTRIAQLLKRKEELKTMPYSEYLETSEWAETRQKALKKAGYHCQLCNDNTSLHVHHRTYERRGEERASDLIVLCQNCHKKFHNIEEDAANG